MNTLKDRLNRKIRFTKERQEHIESDHPEMMDQLSKIKEALLFPEIVKKSVIDEQTELFYRFYNKTPVTSKFMCVIIKVMPGDCFIITAYFTDTIKKGEILWEKK